MKKNINMAKDKIRIKNMKVKWVNNYTSLDQFMELEELYMKMEVFTKDKLNWVLKMVLEDIFIPMELIMLVNFG